MVKLTHSPHRKLSDIVGSFSEKDSKLPVEVDWRKKGFETPNYNQEDCGSCYAFSIAHVLAAQVFKQTDKLVPLRFNNDLIAKQFVNFFYVVANNNLSIAAY